MKNPLLRVTDGDQISTGAPRRTWRDTLIEVRETWPNLLLVTALVLVFAWQVWAGWGDDQPGVWADGAVSKSVLREGRWWTLFTAMVLHGGPFHILLNGLFALAVGNVLILRLGATVSGALRFLGLFVVCGLAGDALYLALHQGDAPMLGASGALCGFWGGMARLSDGKNRFEPLFSRQMGGHLLQFGQMHLWLVGIPLIVGFLAGHIDIPIAWEAHVGGFIAGALLMPLLPQRRGAVAVEQLLSA